MEINKIQRIIATKFSILFKIRRFFHKININQIKMETNLAPQTQ